MEWSTKKVDNRHIARNPNANDRTESRIIMSSFGHSSWAGWPVDPLEEAVYRIHKTHRSAPRG